MTAFQSCSFQYLGFQTAECKKPTPAVVTRNSGGGYVLYDGWDSLFKELPRRNRDEEMLVMMAMFAILEDERG